MALLDVFPRQRLVAIGGVDYVAGQLRVADLARLQAWLDSVVPHPLDLARDDLERADPEQRRRMLLVLRRAAHSHAASIDDPIFSQLLGTRQGLATFLHVLLSVTNEFTLDDALAMTDTITPSELATLYRVAYGVKPQDELERMDQPPRAPAKSQDRWAEMILKVAKDHGWTLDEVGELHLSQFWAALSGGVGRKKVMKKTLTHEDLERLKKEREELGLEG